MSTPQYINSDIACGSYSWCFDSMSDRHIYDFAGKVFDLFEKHETPPDPRSYMVLFSYVARCNKRIEEAIDDLISAGQRVDRNDIVRLYDELTDNHLQTNIQKDIGQNLEQNICAAGKLVEQSTHQNRKFQNALHQTSMNLGNADSTETLESITQRLMSENEEMLQSSLAVGEGLQRSREEIVRLNSQLRELEEMALRDPLTGIANRRAFDARLQEEIDAATSSRPLCLALLDIDHFKRINDLFGHPVGDRVLTKIADILREFENDDTFVARFGGEEFAILMANTDVYKAHNRLIRLRWQISDTSFLSEEDHKRLGFITASFGQSCFRQNRTAQQLVEIADRNLYEAKRAGRNTVVTEGLNEPTHETDNDPIAVPA